MKEEITRFLLREPLPSNRSGRHEMFTVKNISNEKKIINSYFSCDKERFHNNYLINRIYISKPKIERNNLILKGFKEIINLNQENLEFAKNVFENLYNICQEYELYKNSNKININQLLDEKIINKLNLYKESDMYGSRTKLIVENFISLDYGFDKVKDDKSRKVNVEFAFLNSSGKITPVILFQWLFAKNVHRKFFVSLDSTNKFLYEKKGDSYYLINLEEFKNSIEQVIYKLLFNRFKAFFAQDMISERKFFKLSKEFKKDYVTQYKMYHY